MVVPHLTAPVVLWVPALVAFLGFQKSRATSACCMRARAGFDFQPLGTSAELTALGSRKAELSALAK
jgi:hypothetical protein